MTIRRASMFLAFVGALLLAGTAQAEQTSSHKADYGRPGWYVGVGFGGAVDFLEDLLEDEFDFLDLDIKGTWSANARIGYRVTSWFAFEALYEGAYGYESEVLGFKIAEFDTHSVMGNFKFIVPTWRLHPYLGLGFGAQHHTFDSLAFPNVKRWDFVFRPALGLDCYITEHWLVNFEVAPSVSVKSWKNIPDSPTDNISLTAGAGIQYRF
jgi:opacity protein-like surface antigen